MAPRWSVDGEPIADLRRAHTARNGPNLVPAGPRGKIEPMPAYDYRCTVCGRELEILHRIKDSVTAQPHTRPSDGAACNGPLDRLISVVGFAHSVGTKPPSDGQLERAGFTKYVRGSKGYEKAFGAKDTPDFVNRE